MTPRFVVIRLLDTITTLLSDAVRQPGFGAFSYSIAVQLPCVIAAPSLGASAIHLRLWLTFLLSNCQENRNWLGCCDSAILDQLSYKHVVVL